MPAGIPPWMLLGGMAMVRDGRFVIDADECCCEECECPEGAWCVANCAAIYNLSITVDGCALTFTMPRVGPLCQWSEVGVVACGQTWSAHLTCGDPGGACGVDGPVWTLNIQEWGIGTWWWYKHTCVPANDCPDGVYAAIQVWVPPADIECYPHVTWGVTDITATVT